MTETASGRICCTASGHLGNTCTRPCWTPEPPSISRSTDSGTRNPPHINHMRDIRYRWRVHIYVASPQPECFDGKMLPLGRAIPLASAVLCMIATLGMGGPAPSQRAAASGVATVPWTAATAIKVGGAAVTATVRAPASRARLRFKLARTTTVAVTFVSWTFPADGATSAFLADHSGKEIRALRALDGTGPWDARPVRLRAGTYFVVVDTGRSRDSGSVKVQLTAVGAIAANGRAVTVSIGRTQQPRLLAFTARAGSTVVVGATRAAFNAGHGATLGIENGSGIPQAPVTFAGGPIGPVHTAATVHATGRYYVAFRPAVPGSRGSARLTLHVVRPQATAVIGGRAVSVRTTAPGVPALVRFTARARESIAVVAHSTTFSGYAA